MEMLEVVVISFEGSEGNVESNWNIGFEDCALRKYLEDCHVLTIEILLFLGYPGKSQFALHFVCDFDLPLTTHGQDFIITKVDDV